MFIPYNFGEAEKGTIAFALKLVEKRASTEVVVDGSGGCGKVAGTYEFFLTAYEIDMQMLCEVFPASTTAAAATHRKTRKNHNDGDDSFLLPR